MLDLQQSKILISLLKNDSFSSVARELRITQPAVSLAIKNIEKKLKVPLVLRGKKKASLTPIGRKLAILSKEYSYKSEQILESSFEEEREINGQVKIGSVHGAGKSWVSSCLMKLMKNYPELDAKYYLADPDELIRLFNTLEIDGMILPSSAPTPARGNEYGLGEEQLAFVHSKELNLSIDKVQNNYQDLSWICSGEHDANIDLWIKHHFKKKIRYKKRMVSNSYGSILTAVSENLGVAILPLHVLERSVIGDKITILEGSEKIKAGKLKFVVQKHLEKSSKLKLFYENLKVDNQEG